MMFVVAPLFVPWRRQRYDSGRAPHASTEKDAFSLTFATTLVPCGWSRMSGLCGWHQVRTTSLTTPVFRSTAILYVVFEVAVKMTRLVIAAPESSLLTMRLKLLTLLPV